MAACLVLTVVSMMVVCPLLVAVAVELLESVTAASTIVSAVKPVVVVTHSLPFPSTFFASVCALSTMRNIVATVATRSLRQTIRVTVI